MSAPWIEELERLVGGDQVATTGAVLDQHSRGESYDRAVRPDAVAYPTTTETVASIMRFANEHRIPVTPVAVNSSLEGHTVPLHGGISLDLTRMDRILAFAPDDLLVVVQPGVTYPRVNDHTRRSGLFFPVDPGAHASIGGMIGTNASGTAAVRYGVTADYVLALEIVTPTGDVIRTGSRARKSSSGYPLARLMCGSEGTLGVVTEATLRLVGLPSATVAARVPFADATAATRYVTALIQAGVPVARCELIDPRAIRAVNAHQGTTYPDQMTIFLEFHGNEAGLEQDAELARDLAETMGSLAFEASTDPEERDRLWEARHNVYWAMVAAQPESGNLTTDVAVPISRLPEAVELGLRASAKEGLDASIVGHVGDGNFHLLVFFSDDAERAAAERVSGRLVDFALSAGGTSTGEHGVGIRKLGYMEREHGASLGWMQAIKRALDPNGIMNPGKKVPM